MPKRTLQSVDDLSEDILKFFESLNSSSDLAVVVVAASYIDASLGSLLHGHFAKSSISDSLLDTRGPLGAIAARADLSYSLSLIDKPLYKAISKIIEIRNQFAHHHLERSFSSADISTLCSELRFLEDSGLEQAYSGYIKNHMSTTRDRFVSHAAIVAQRILLRAEEVAK